MNGQNYSFADLGNAAYNTCGTCTVPYSSPGLSANRDSSAFGGIFAGFNYQFAPQLVAGAEGDISWTNLSVSASGPLFSDLSGNGVPIVPVPGSNLSFHTDVQWIATARARLGWLWTPNLLIYGTGGAAWGRFTNYANATCDVAGSSCFFTTFLEGAPFSDVNTETGWVDGGGVEWQMAAHVRARVEYLYYRFDETINGTSPFIPGGPGGVGPACGPNGVTGPCLAAFGFSGNLNIQTVRGGISYAF